MPCWRRLSLRNVLIAFKLAQMQMEIVNCAFLEGVANRVQPYRQLHQLILVQASRAGLV